MTNLRLAPLTFEEMTEDQRALVSATEGTPPLNIFATLVRAPGLFRRWSPFAGKLLAGGKLPGRDREIVILRTAYRCSAEYEWGQHVAIAQAAGVSAEEIVRIGAGPSEDGWSDHDRALLVAVDELQDAHCVSDATWQTLASTYSDDQMIELLMLSGHYALLAGALNSCGVQPERTLPALGEA